MQLFYKLNELPEKYQRIFENRRVPSNDDYEYYHTTTAYILTGLLVIFPVMPLVYIFLGLIYGGLEFMYQKPDKLLEPFQEDINIGIILIIIVAVCVLVAGIGVGLYWCFYVVMMFIQDIRIARAKRKGEFIYGLLLTKTHLIWRKKNLLKPIFIIPKEHINGFNTYHKRAEKGRRIKYFALEYRTSEGQNYIEFTIDEFQIKNGDSDNIIQAWLAKN